MPIGNRLDVVATEQMATGLYYRVHPTLHPARPGTVLSPLEANPASAARLALRGDATLGVAPRGMFYVATSPAAALFEALLRHARIFPERRIVIPWRGLQGQTLSTVRLLTPEAYVPLMKPERGLVVHDAAKDAEWQWLVNTPHHADTHRAATEVAAQFAAAVGHDGLPRMLPGFGYPSIQCSGDSVYLHYDPPMRPSAWRVEQSVDLSLADGCRVLLIALAERGFLPLESPGRTATFDFDPPPGAL